MGATLQCVRTLTGGPPVIEYYALITGANVRDGVPLRMNKTSPGSVQSCSAAATGIIGVAGITYDATATEKTKHIPVIVACRTNVFRGVGLTTTGVAAKIRGDMIDLKASGSTWGVDSGASTTKACKVVNCRDEDKAKTGITGSRIRYFDFIFAYAKSQYDGAMEVD